nr:DiNacetylchitobiase putative [Albugo laibachii Nc14]|eukprot:CCA27450.1 DiNacetylchitobiase putative [Albugo laibachii Nc14]
MALSSCPCLGEDLQATLPPCLPVNTEGRNRKEVFAFSPSKVDKWRHYDWDQVTTIAWDEDKRLVCHAHKKGVKIVVTLGFDNFDKICDHETRQVWIRRVYEKIVTNYADGFNFDIEKPSSGAKSHCYVLLVKELRHVLKQSEYTKNAQITVDVPWAPHGIDGRYYDWNALAEAADFLFVMSYDMRSQIYYQCIASANSPLALVRKGLEEYLLGYNIAPDKLVLGLPWYAYDYKCQNYSAALDICQIEQVPFAGAPCSDAAGKQRNYEVIRARAAADPAHYVRRWDNISHTPYYTYTNFEMNETGQIWFEDPDSLSAKYALVREFGLRGGGMWHADGLSYGKDDESKKMWDSFKAMY